MLTMEVRRFCSKASTATLSETHPSGISRKALKVDTSSLVGSAHHVGGSGMSERKRWIDAVKDDGVKQTAKHQDRGHSARKQPLGPNTKR